MLTTVPSNDEIATQKLTAYAALSLFHEMSSSQRVIVDVVVVVVIISEEVNISWP